MIFGKLQHSCFWRAEQWVATMKITFANVNEPLVVQRFHSTFVTSQIITFVDLEAIFTG